MHMHDNSVIFTCVLNLDTPNFAWLLLSFFFHPLCTWWLHFACLNPWRQFSFLFFSFLSLFLSWFLSFFISLFSIKNNKKKTIFPQAATYPVFSLDCSSCASSWSNHSTLGYGLASFGVVFGSRNLSRSTDNMKEIITGLINLSKYFLYLAKKRMFGCTPPTNPNVQGRPKYFCSWKKQSKKWNFLPKIVFLKISKHETYQKKKKIDKNVLFFIKYSWQALLLCNKPFDLLKILVFDFTLSSELQNHKICTVRKKINKIWLTDPIFFRHRSTTNFFFL